MTIGSSKKITLLSFVFTIIIVCYHSNINIYEFFRTEWIGTIVFGFWEFAANVAMSFFFMLTGFLLYNGAELTNIKDKLKRRMQNIIIPFLVWNTLYYIVSILQHGFRDGICTVLYRFSFDPYDGPLWYLFAITLLSLFAPIVLKNKDKIWFRICGVIIVFMAVSFFSLEILTTRFDTHIASWCERLCRYIPSYVLGGAIALYYPEMIDKKRTISLWLLLPFSVLSIIWIVSGDSLHAGFKLLTLWIVPVFVWNYVTTNDSTNRFARNSFFMYAIHRLIVTGATLFLGGLITLIHEDSLIIDTLCLLLPLLICLAIWLICEAMVKGANLCHLDFVVKVFTGGRK